MARKYRVTVNGTAYEVEVQLMGEVASASSQPVMLTESTKIPVAVPSESVPVMKTSKSVSVVGESTVSSPMPGKIIKVIAQQGQNVNEGDVLMILEAMKMENEIVAPVSGVVAEIRAKEGASVNSGDVLAVIGG